MNSPRYFSFPAHWSAHDLADAVPLRLSELFAFDAMLDGAFAASANAASGAAPAPRAWRHRYVRSAPAPAAFRVH